MAHHFRPRSVRALQTSIASTTLPPVLVTHRAMVWLNAWRKQWNKARSVQLQDKTLRYLCWSTETPLTTIIPSPAQLLNGRKYRASLPARSLMQNIHGQIVRERMVEDKNKSSTHYNRSAKNLPLLSQHQRVFVQVEPQSNQWSPATVTRIPLAS